MRERAGMLAEAGFTAMIWNPYPGQQAPADMAQAQTMAASSTTARSAPWSAASIICSAP